MSWLFSIAMAVPLEGQLTVDGEPVPDALVVAYDERFRFETSTSDSEGRYAFDLVPSAYRIRVLPSESTNVAEAWAGGSLDVCGSETVVVGSEGVTVDMGLEPGRVLRGQIARRDHTPFVGEVSVAPIWQDQVGVSDRSAFTDEEGFFEVVGLPDGRSLPTDLIVEIPKGVVPEQFFEGVFDEEFATPVDASGDTTEMDLFSVRDGVGLRGDIVGPDGPVEGAEVNAFAGRRNTIGATSADGTFALDGLREGEVLFWAVAPGLARTYWPDADRPPETALRVEPERTVFDIGTITMPAEARLQGVLAVETPVADTTVLLVNDDDSVAIAGAVAEDGSFDVGGLPAGMWTLELYGQAIGIVEGTQVDASGQPIRFDLSEGEVLDIGEHVPILGSTVEGTVLDLDSGEPVYGAFVIAERLEDESRRLGFTDRDGTFSIPSLPAGSWTLLAGYSAFCPADGTWVTTYWPQQVNPGVGGSVALGAGEVFEWTVSLARDVDGDEMGDSWEVAHGLDPERDDSEEDPDGDGFPNLVEYRLGTDPNQVFEEGCSCGSGRAGAVGMLFGILAFAARQRRGTPLG